MPEAMVSRDIKSGKLARLNLPDWRGGVYPMQVMHLADRPPGPAGRWLIDRLLTLEATIDPAGLEAPRNKKRVRGRRPTAHEA
jgi:hypothetical protein